jgi:hypothetical protein
VNIINILGEIKPCPGIQIVFIGSAVHVQCDFKAILEVTCPNLYLGP